MIQSLLFMALLAIGLYLAIITASVAVRGRDNGVDAGTTLYRGFIAAILAPAFWAWFITFVLM